MSIIGFPNAPKKEWVKPKTLEDWPWEKDLGKPYGDINGDVRPEIVGEAQAAHYKDASPASEILNKAAGLIDGERNMQHGDRKECHTLIARLWTAYLGVQITPKEVALMMALLKIARTKSGSYNGDCYVDLCGYGSIAGQFAHDEIG